MEPVQYLRALRQWWWVVVACGLIGVIVAVVSSPASTTEYSATHDLIYAPRAATGEEGVTEDPATTVSRLAFLATRGEVLTAVAEKLGEDPSDLVPRVSGAADPDLGALSITATGTDARDTEALADAFADELVAQLDADAVAARDTEVAQLQTEVNDLTAQIAVLDRSIDPLAPDTGAVAQRDALTAQFTDASARLRELSAAAAPTSGLSTITPAVATVESGGETSGAERLLIAGFVGLLIGAGLALVLTRFDTRIRTKEEAEEAFGLPVIAEIPMLSRTARKRHDVVSIAEPDSSGSEAYRSLRTSLVFAPRVRWSLNETGDRSRRNRAKDQRNSEAKPDPRRSQTVLVVSPGVSEGKSTTVANLAVAFAESGKYVLVLSGDLRRPMVDGYLGVEPGPGMSELLAGDDGVGLADVVRATSVPDVRMIPSGETVTNPGELLSHHGAALVEQARNLADVVLVDSPPLLATDDASPLLPQIDDVLVVCRAGVTTAEAARRTSELLNRLGASVAGVALIGAAAVPTIRGYYRAYGSPRARDRNATGVAAEAASGDGTAEGSGAVDGRRVEASDTA